MRKKGGMPEDVSTAIQPPHTLGRRPTEPPPPPPALTDPPSLGALDLTCRSRREDEAGPVSPSRGLALNGRMPCPTCHSLTNSGYVHPPGATRPSQWAGSCSWSTYRTPTPDAPVVVFYPVYVVPYWGPTYWHDDTVGQSRPSSVWPAYRSGWRGRV